MTNPLPFPPPPAENLLKPVKVPSNLAAADKSITPPTPKPSAQNDTTPTVLNGPVEANSSGKFIVRVYPDKCIAAASCVATASKAFKLNSLDTVEIIPTIIKESDAQLLLAAQSCPTMAIEIIDAATGEKIWPN